MVKFMTRREACEALGIHYHTLYALAERKEIEIIQIGKQQMYNIDKLISLEFFLRKNLIKSISRRLCCLFSVVNFYNFISQSRF